MEQNTLIQLDLLKKTFEPIFMDAIELSQAYRSTETVDFLPVSPQEILVLIWSPSEGWKVEFTFEPPGELQECLTINISGRNQSMSETFSRI